MKIGIVSAYDYSHPGGVINHVSYLGHYLQARGHEVKIIAPMRRKNTRYFGEDVTPVGRPIPIPYGGTTARIPLSPWLPYQVKRVLEREKFDVIHLHEPFIPMLCLSTLTESQTVNVGTFHACHDHSVMYWLGQPIMRKLGRKLHGKIAVSKPALDYISKYLPTVAASPCFSISALKAPMTSFAPEATQPEPAQMETQGLSGSLLDSISCLKPSNSSGEFNLAIIFPYS